MKRSILRLSSLWSYAEKEEGIVDFKGQDVINPTTAASEQVMTSSMLASLQSNAAEVTANENFAYAF